MPHVVSGVPENILAKALGQDVTQLPALEKRALLARLLKRLAHEIRNPLSSLDVHFQLLEEDLSALAPALAPEFPSPVNCSMKQLPQATPLWAAKP